MNKYYKTSDLPRAAFLVTKGFKCLGSVPDEGDKRGNRREFVLEYAESETNRFLEMEDDYLNGRDNVSAIEFYRAQTKIKHYITDSEKLHGN